MTRTVPTLHCIALLAALPLAGLATAQEPDPNENPPAVTAQGQGSGGGSAMAKGPITINLEFPGGGLPDYLAAVQRAVADQHRNAVLNIVQPQGSRKFDVPSLELTDVSVESALETLQHVESEDVDVDVKRVSDRGSEPVYVVMARTRSRNVMPGPQGEVYATFSLRDLTMAPEGMANIQGAKVAAEDVLGAIELASQMFREGERPELLFHKESALLFVRGTHEQTSLVRNLVSQLAQDVERVRTRNAKPPAPPAPSAPREAKPPEAPEKPAKPEQGGERRNR